MSKVLVVATNRERMPDPIPPIGAAYVAAAARAAGHAVALFDACFAADWAHDLEAALAAHAPDVIACSLRNVDNVAYPHVTSYVDQYKAIVERCRARAPGAFLVLGGSAFSLFPEELMAALGADLGIVGEGEAAFVRLLAELDWDEAAARRAARAAPIVVPDRAADFAAGLRPAFDLLDARRYLAEGGALNVQTKRGCDFQCIYCTYPMLEGRAIRAREPRAVVRELEDHVAAYGADFFFFVDNTFNHPAWHARAVCEEILARGLRIKWSAYATPAGLTRELLALMRTSGCESLELGTDAFCDAQLARLGKAFTVRELADVSAWCREEGIAFCHALLFGGPGETWETVKETVANTLASRPNAVVAMAGLRIYAGTALARHAVAAGVLPQERICLTPEFFLSPEVKEGLVAYLQDVAAQHKNWLVPGLGANMNPRYLARLRSRGFKGPLWQLLAPE